MKQMERKRRGKLVKQKNKKTKKERKLPKVHPCLWKSEYPSICCWGPHAHTWCGDPGFAHDSPRPPPIPSASGRYFSWSGALLGGVFRPPFLRQLSLCWSGLPAVSLTLSTSLGSPRSHPGGPLDSTPLHPPAVWQQPLSPSWSTCVT